MNYENATMKTKLYSYIKREFHNQNQIWNMVLIDKNCSA